MTGISYNPKRPCVHPGCSGTGAFYGTCKKTGRRRYRNFCLKHHTARIAEKHGMPTAKHVTASRQGLSVTEYKNRSHRYLKYRKDHCENVDGRLGYVCTTTIPGTYVLDVDHVDGNPSNNDPSNLQTLCKVCHAHKTIVYRDYETPGRKTLGIAR